MKGNTIHYNTAIHWTNPSTKIVETPEISKEEIIQEIKETHLECMDATDINYFARKAGIEPNEVRRLMIQCDDTEKGFLDLLHSFDNDDTDSLIDFF